MTPPHIALYLLVVATKTSSKHQTPKLSPPNPLAFCVLRNHYPAKAKNKESKVKVTASNLIRWAGLSAMAAGSLFVVIQAIHPLDLLSSVSTAQWAIAHYLGVAMCTLGVFGLVGIYARQVEKAGWLGLAGYLLFSLFWMLTTAFQFIEALVTPQLVTVAPKYVEGFLGIPSGYASEVSLGALPMVYNLTGFAGYMLGGLLFGIATFRAGVLPRWAGGLLAFGVVLPLVASGLVPHPFDRIFALPVGIAIVWLGYALWSERRETASQAVPATQSPQLRQAEAK
jgi:hypothetical protein